jgi:wyosine [tRNA(Phe)-imidazoG37] synthetase (radical SAM superfamily)
MTYRHLFGPIQSRRLGASLGVDMVTAKTCTLDCVYCECGATTLHTAERREYVPATEIKAELAHFLDSSPVLDFVTFGGSGEPTLNTALGDLIAFVCDSFPQYKTAVLTNGTLLGDSAVRAALMRASVVLPSLDAVLPATFARLNRHCEGIELDTMIEGLVEFSREYTGRILLEVFIIPGLNDSPEEIQLFKSVIARIGPEQVQLNSLDRPGTCEWVTPADRATLERIARELAPLPVKIVSRAAGMPQPPHRSAH